MPWVKYVPVSVHIPLHFFLCIGCAWVCVCSTSVLMCTCLANNVVTPNSLQRRVVGVCLTPNFIPFCIYMAGQSMASPLSDLEATVWKAIMRAHITEINDQQFEEVLPYSTHTSTHQVVSMPGDMRQRGKIKVGHASMDVHLQ